MPDAEKAVVVSQDLEHQPGKETRVNNSGVKIQPRSSDQRIADDSALTHEDA